MAEDNRIQLEIVTPKGRALAVAVDEVSLPGENGEFGVLPGHLSGHFLASILSFSN